MREAAVQRLFSRLAPRYGLLNTVLTFGLHKLWRRTAMASVPVGDGLRALDVCAGTGDFSLALLRRGMNVTAVDLSAEMLTVARRRAGNRLAAVIGDALHLPIASASADCVTVGFGLRHCEDDLPLLLAELRRALKPGGVAVVLEMSHPPNRIWRQLVNLYLHTAVPLIGRLVDAEAYEYLGRSVRNYPDAPTLRAMLLDAGFDECWFRLVSGGVAAVHVASVSR